MTASPKMQAMQLAEQINDEFLTCKICYEPFKEPKCLSCLHTFCEDCIEQHVSAQRSYKYTDYREFSCPICRKKTVIPTGGVRKLTDNFLISSLSELLVAKQPSKVPMCDICKLTLQREREASSKCVECQKCMCNGCLATHAQMKITSTHNVYELEIEKDILCKSHPNETVRFYCEACEQCVCVACTYTEHRSHDLVDFKEVISLHKDKIEDNLRKCRVKIGEIRTRLDMLKKCETRILVTQNQIHATALSFIDLVRERETHLLDEINEYYGEDTVEYLKKKDELETFLEQLKSTCALTDVVVKGRDIEMLLLKKQLCEKFEQFQETQMDPLPKNIMKKIHFEPGSFHLGDIKNPDDDFRLNGSDREEDEDAECEKKEADDDGSQKNRAGSTSSYCDASADEVEEKLEIKEPTSFEKATQIGHRDFREIVGERIRETETQTDIRMIHELAPPSRDRRANNNTLANKTDSKYVQTEAQEATAAVAVAASTEVKTRSALGSQSSNEEENVASSNAPVDMNKLSRRVRKYVKPGCNISVIPLTSDIIIIDAESNSVVILDKRGKYRYGVANAAVRETYGKLDKGVRFTTPQGVLTIKLESEATLVSEGRNENRAYDSLPETSA